MNRQDQIDETEDLGGELAPFDAVESGATLEDMSRARPIPRISIQAFCDDTRAAEVLQYAAEDRRLSKAHVVAINCDAIP